MWQLEAAKDGDESVTISKRTGMWQLKLRPLPAPGQYFIKRWDQESQIKEPHLTQVTESTSRWMSLANNYGSG